MQPRDPPELSGVECDQRMFVLKGGGGNQQVVGANHLTGFFQGRPQDGVPASHRDVEVDGLDFGEHGFDKPGALFLPGGRLSPFDAMQQFGRGNGGDEKKLVGRLKTYKAASGG